MTHGHGSCISFVHYLSKANEGETNEGETTPCRACIKEGDGGVRPPSVRRQHGRGGHEQPCKPRRFSCSYRSLCSLTPGAAAHWAVLVLRRPPQDAVHVEAVCAVAEHCGACNRRAHSQGQEAGKGTVKEGGDPHSQGQEAGKGRVQAGEGRVHGQGRKRVRAGVRAGHSQWQEAGKGRRKGRPQSRQEAGKGTVQAGRGRGYWSTSQELRIGQSSPGSLQSVQGPSKGMRQMPHVSSSTSHFHTATAVHLRDVPRTHGCERISLSSSANRRGE